MKKQVSPITRSLQLGAALLLALGMLVSVSVVVARPLPPNAPNGVIVHACPDSYEVDDLMSEAKPLLSGVPQQHTFDGNTNLGIPDKDWVKFPVVRTGIYTLTTYNLSPLADTVIDLYDASGNIVAQNDDSGAADFGSQIVWTAPALASGDYYLLIQNSPKSPVPAATSCADVVLTYTLSLQSKEPLFMFLPMIVKNF